MPNVLIEAMGLGLPVVATSVEGVKEVLGPLAEGQAVPSGDGAAFVDAVCAIIGDSTLSAKLGEENNARVRAEFSLRAMIAKYEELYSE
jgi:glycosyltransferase involved in cell wall biosynthesis